MEEATHFQSEERRAVACDLRAAMADKDGFAKYFDGLKPKRDG